MIFISKKGFFLISGKTLFLAEKKSTTIELSIKFCLSTRRNLMFKFLSPILHTPSEVLHLYQLIPSLFLWFSGLEHFFFPEQWLKITDKFVAFCCRC